MPKTRIAAVSSAIASTLSAFWLSKKLIVPEEILPNDSPVHPLHVSHDCQDRKNAYVGAEQHGATSPECERHIRA